VTGDEHVGGLVGVNWVGTVSNSFWDTKSSGQAISAGGKGKTTAEMQDITTFLEAAWDIFAVAPDATNLAYTWNIVHEQTYPFLSWRPVVYLVQLELGMSLHPVTARSRKSAEVPEGR